MIRYPTPIGDGPIRPEGARAVPMARISACLKALVSQFEWNFTGKLPKCEVFSVPNAGNGSGQSTIFTTLLFCV